MKAVFYSIVVDREWEKTLLFSTVQCIIHYSLCLTVCTFLIIIIIIMLFSFGIHKVFHPVEFRWGSTWRGGEREREKMRCALYFSIFYNHIHHTPNTMKHIQCNDVWACEKAYAFCGAIRTGIKRKQPYPLLERRKNKMEKYLLIFISTIV